MAYKGKIYLTLDTYIWYHVFSVCWYVCFSCPKLHSAGCAATDAILRYVIIGT